MNGPENGYQPSEEKIEAAEQTMDSEQKEMSDERAAHISEVREGLYADKSPETQARLLELDREIQKELQGKEKTIEDGKEKMWVAPGLTSTTGIAEGFEGRAAELQKEKDELLASE